MPPKMALFSSSKRQGKLRLWIVIHRISGAPRARHLSICLVVTWPHVLPPVRQVAQGNQCEISHFLALVGGCNLMYTNAVVNWQLSKQCIRCPVLHDWSWAQVSTHRCWVFLFKLFKLLVFKWSQAQLQVDFFTSLFEMNYEFINGTGSS